MNQISRLKAAKFYACANMGLTYTDIPKAESDITTIKGQSVPLTDKGCDLIWNEITATIDESHYDSLLDEKEWWSKKLKLASFKKCALDHYGIIIV